MNKTKNKEAKNAVIYARYSSHGQTEQSIEGQLRDCYAYCEREGIKVVGEYIDRAITGRSDDRPQFQRMIEDASKRQFQLIIVWKLDRFTRNRYDSALYKTKLKKYGVRVVSATENISDDPEGIILEGLLESMAEYYSANLSKHVRRGLRESVIKGTYTGGVPPIGYKVENKKLVIDENTAHIIRFAFEQYAAGVAKKDIIAELNAKGIRNGRGKPLTMTSFQAALRNKKYMGVYLYNGQEVTGGCPAIVSEKTFIKVQERLDAVKKAPATGKGRVDYLLQGKAFCGYCGAPMVGESGRGKMGTWYHYYACADRKKKHTCEKKNEKKDYIEWYVCEQTVEYVLTPERIDYIAARIVARYNEEFNDIKVVNLEKRLEKIDRDITKAVDASLEAPAKARPVYYEKIELLETQKIDIELDLAKLKLANKIRYSEEEIKAWLKIFCRGDLFDMEFRKRLIDTFINSIYLFDDKVVIYYNIKDGKQVSFIEMIDSSEEPPFGGDPDTCNGIDNLSGTCYNGVRISNDTSRQNSVYSLRMDAVFLHFEPFEGRNYPKVKCLPKCFCQAENPPPIIIEKSPT